MAKKRYDFRFSEELVGRVDAVRGDASRTLFIERALEEALRGAPVVGSPGGRKSPGGFAAARSGPTSPRTSADIDPALKARLARFGKT